MDALAAPRPQNVDQMASDHPVVNFGAPYAGLGFRVWGLGFRV